MALTEATNFSKCHLQEFDHSIHDLSGRVFQQDIVIDHHMVALWGRCDGRSGLGTVAHDMVSWSQAVLFPYFFSFVV